MKLLFIYPDISTSNHRYFQQGIAWISSVLKQNGHKTSMLHLTKDQSREELLEKVKGYNPDVIAFSATTNQYPFAEKYARWLKEVGVPVVCGGIHATLAPEEVIASDGFDIVCVGEGEYPMLELLNRLEAGKNIEEIKNLWVKKSDKIIRNDTRDIIDDLDALPFPDRELYDYEKFLQENGNTAEFLAGRGCPYDCTYCCNHAIRKIGKGRYVRIRSVDNVIEEIREVTAKYKVKNLWFYDDTFTLFPKWIEEFSEKYRQEFDMPFACNGRIETLKEEMLVDLKKAGCTMMGIGVESGNEQLRNMVLKRKMSNDQIIRGFGMVKIAGIEANAFYMIGLPFETPEMIEETLALNERINPDGIQFSVFYPYPGTELYTVSKEHGFLTGKKKESYFEEGTTLELPALSREKLKYYYNRFEMLQNKAFNRRIKNKYPGVYPFYWAAKSIFGQEKAYEFFRRIHSMLT